MNRVESSDRLSSSALNADTEYRLLCYAKDNWDEEVADAAQHSPNYSPGSAANAVSYRVA